MDYNITVHILSSKDRTAMCGKTYDYTQTLDQFYANNGEFHVYGGTTPNAYCTACSELAYDPIYRLAYLNI